MPSTHSRAANESAKRTAALISQMATGRKRSAPEDAPKSPPKARIIQKGNHENDKPLETLTSVKQRLKGLNQPQKSLRSTSHPGRGEDLFDLSAEDSIKVLEPRSSNQNPTNAVLVSRARNPPEASEHAQVPARPRGRPKKPQADALVNASEQTQASARPRGHPRKSQAEATPPESPVANGLDLPPSPRLRNKVIAEQNAITDEGYGSSITVGPLLQELVTSSGESPSTAIEGGDDDLVIQPQVATNGPSPDQGEGDGDGFHDAEDLESIASDDSELSSSEDDGEADILDDFGIKTAA